MNKNKVVFYTRGLEFDGGSVDRAGLGGSESALTYMAREFSSLGFDTHVFCNCRHPRVYDGVTYHHFEEKIPSCDYLFCYRFPEIIPLVKARIKVLVLHDMPVLQKQIADVLWAVDKVFFLSEFQKKAWLEQFPSMSKIAYLTKNGFAKEIVDEVSDVVFDLNQVIWASRPERGLDILLGSIWPVLSKKFPDLQLVLADYGSWEDPKLFEFYEKCDCLISQFSNVTCKGSLPKKEFYKLLKSSGCLVYPAVFPEVSCIVAIEAQAVGTPVVTTDKWALSETVDFGVLVQKRSEESYSADFISAVSSVLERKAFFNSPKVKSWFEIALDWVSYLQDYSRERSKTIAACVVAKNEEDNIIRCLKSLQHSVHYIKVLVDSSQDRTYELAQQYADEVLKASFSDLDFSELRKTMIRNVKQDWILWVDADEVLLGGENLIKYTESAICEAYRFKQINVALEPHQWGHETPIRLFKNQREVSFKGKVHEQVEFGDHLEIGSLPLIKDVKILHLGYVTPDLVWEKFYKRNEILLEEEIKSGSVRPLLPIYKMRDCMYRFIREQEVSFKFLSHVLEEIIMVWEEVFEGKEREHVDLAWSLYQRALRELANKGFPYKGNVPFLIKVEMRLNKAKKVEMVAWFRNKDEYQKKLNSLVDHVGGLSGSS